MRTRILFVCLLLIGWRVLAQLPGTSTSNGSGAPTDSCGLGIKNISIDGISSTGYAWTCKAGAWVLGATSGVMSGTTGSIGGSLLAAGASASGTATVIGATVGMVCTAQPSDGTNIYALGANIGCTVTAANTVTVNVVAIVTLTPVAKSYVVRVIP